MKPWEAVKALEEGKKVRIKNWNVNSYIYMNGLDIYDHNDNKCFTSIVNLLINDWELYEESKRLRDLEVGKLFKVKNGSNKKYMKINETCGCNSIDFENEQLVWISETKEVYESLKSI
jgi:hypothetical protein